MRHEWKIADCGEPYAVTLADEDPKWFGKELAERLETSRVFLLMQSPAAQAWGGCIEQSLRDHGVSVATCLLPDGEGVKTLRQVETVWRFLHRHQANRQTPIVALGGGSLTDIAGFAAATYHRGLPLVHCPTTLMGQADASIGGKTAINFGKTKNNIGAFYSPRWVYSNVRFLKTLPEREWRSGFAEVIKAAAIADRNLFDALLASDSATLFADPSALFPVLQKAMAIKIDLVCCDPRETKQERTKLNFGHTIGHAIEAAGRFEQWTHGEAVGLGMFLESRVSSLFGHCRAYDAQELRQLLQHYALPVDCDLPAAWKRHLLADKKRSEADLAFVFLRHIGHTIVKSVPIHDWLQQVRVLEKQDASGAAK